MLCSVVALYQALGQAHIGMCLFLCPQTQGEKNQMETREPYLSEFTGPPQTDETAAVFSLLCAINRFYAFNRDLLDGSVARLVLLNRISSEMEIELAVSGLREPYAADLIHIGEELNIGIRSRIPGKNLIAVKFAPTVPGLEELRKICGTGEDHYRVGMGIGLGRNSFQAVWHTAEEAVRCEMEQCFPQWTKWASFHRNPS